MGWGAAGPGDWWGVSAGLGAQGQSPGVPAAPPLTGGAGASLAVAALVSALLEAVTAQVDNIFVPLHLYALLAVLER